MGIDGSARELDEFGMVSSLRNQMYDWSYAEFRETTMMARGDTRSAAALDADLGLALTMMHFALAYPDDSSSLLHLVREEKFSQLSGNAQVMHHHLTGACDRECAS